MTRAGATREPHRAAGLGRPPIAPELKEQIQEALKAPGRTEGVRVIAERFGINPGTVQVISMELAGRPFDASAAAGPALTQAAPLIRFGGLPALWLPFARKIRHRLPALFNTLSSDEPVSAMSRKERADAQWLTRAGSKPEPCRSNRRQGRARAKDEFAIAELPVLAQLVRCR